MNKPAPVPDVKVVLTTFRRAALLYEALESAFGQIGASIHVVVVDDHSDDDTEDVMNRAAARRTGQITLIAKSVNRGVADSVRAGLEAGLRAPYVAFLNDDDRWLPNKLSLQLRVLARNPAISGCFSDAFVIDAGGHRTGKLYSDQLGPFISCAYDQLFEADPVCASTLVLRADVADRVARTIPGKALAWDYYAVLMAASLGELVRIGAPLAEYRVSAGSFRSRADEHARSTTEVRLAAVRAVPSITLRLGGEGATRRLIALVTLKEALMRLECRQWRGFLWQAAVVVRQRQLRTVAWLGLHTVTTLRGCGPMRNGDHGD